MSPRGSETFRRFGKILLSPNSPESLLSEFSLPRFICLLYGSGGVSVLRLEQGEVDHSRSAGCGVVLLLILVSLSRFSSLSSDLLSPPNTIGISVTG